MTAKFDLKTMIDNLPAGLDRAILRILSYHTGADNAVSRYLLLVKLAQHGFNFAQTNADGSEKLDPRTGHKIFNDRPVRIAINQLRKSGSPICSTGGVGGGYYLAAGWIELDAYIEKELHSRAMDLLEQEKALKQAGRKLWGEYSPEIQPSLFG